jgi:hypothetical protein
VLFPNPPAMSSESKYLRHDSTLNRAFISVLAAFSPCTSWIGVCIRLELRGLLYPCT